jgi:hypothetical protein
VWLLRQHVAPGHSAGRGGLVAAGGVGLAVSELGEDQLRRRSGEAGYVGERVAQQRRLVERVCRVKRPQQLRGQLRHRSGALAASTQHAGHGSLHRRSAAPDQGARAAVLDWRLCARDDVSLTGCVLRGTTASALRVRRRKGEGATLKETRRGGAAHR